MNISIPSLPDWLLQSSLALTGVYAIYRIFLAKITQFQFNRFFLLGGSLVSLLLPMLSIDAPQALGEFTLPTMNVAAAEFSGESGFQMPSWMTVLGIIYLAGVLISGTKFGMELFRLFAFVRKHPTTQEAGIPVIQTDGAIPTSSFLRWILWDNSQNLSPEERLQMWQHEQCHILQRHTYDILVMRLLLIVCWFHPLAYQLHQALRLTHEYLADRVAVSAGEPARYARLLVRQTLGRQWLPAHAFSQSPTKTRIVMLTKSTSRFKSWINTSLALSMMCLLAVSIGCSQELDQVEAETVSRGEPTVIQVQDADQAPTPLNMVDLYTKIGYPKSLQDAEVQGMVVARILVSPEGTYVKHEILKEDHPLLSEAVVPHLKDLLFEPAMKDGKPVKFWVNIPFNFKLSEEEELPKIKEIPSDN
ncbi:M56 family metallopeptidase [Pontibacter sp. G13]|uniref:M56 family metallopeptidase n=1 Tax=Pontibacter sp. G13 TaxID=3074898 RepID=UPI00288A3042|nr:M56 family metallopeptidase [Pontibacter sp. G13]WNJ19732.1 M56 family metallopeptidase [Pontibacter sp. G13]